MPELSYTLRNVLLGSSLLGLLGGVLGTFTLLRRQSLLGDALAHAALPGVCLAFLLTGSKHPIALLAGALFSGILGALYILSIARWSRVKEDSAIGIVLSVFFGVGIVMLTRIQRMPEGNQAGLNKYLFGQAATLMEGDLILMAILAGLVFFVVFLLFKEFKLVSFDAAFGASLGLPMRRLEILLTCLLVVVVVVGLQTVGVVLMVATLITPAAAARQWTDRLGHMVFLSGGLGAIAGASGALLSDTLERVPTGPTIVLISSAILIVSLLLAPQRGIVWAYFRSRMVRRRIQRENLLKDLYRLGEGAGAIGEYVPIPTVMGLRGQGRRVLDRSIRPLQREMLVRVEKDRLSLTRDGVTEAERVVRTHRLWEVYLTRRLELPSDHVHRDAEAMEHALSEEAVHELDRQLGYPSLDPHGRPIPRGERA